MIKVIYNSEVVGTFSKLTLVFRYYYKKLDKVFNEEEVQVAFLLEEGILDTEILHQLTKKTALSSPRYTIKFTLQDKDYFINRGAFDCIQSGITFKNLSSYKRIEGVGELVNPKEFPIHLLDRNVLVVNKPFNSDWISPPGDTITDILEEKGWSKADLANKLNKSENFVKLLIKGQIKINEELATKLTKILGSSVNFWLNRETAYRKYKES